MFVEISVIIYYGIVIDQSLISAVYVAPVITYTYINYVTVN